MPRFRFIALVLALMLAPQIGTAEAAYIRRPKIKDVSDSNSNVSYRIVVAADAGGQVSAVNARVESDAGGEDVKLSNHGPLVHGSATIAKLPATDARITLWVQGKTEAISFSGMLGADGSLTLTADSKMPDLQLLGAELFPTSSGYDLAFDLTGADLYNITSAKVSIVESDEGTICTTKPERRCSKTGSTTTTAAEVVWDEIGVAWEGELTLEHAGIVETKVTAYDAKGGKLETTKFSLGTPWLDRGQGINALAIDADPLTTMALFGFDKNNDGKINTNDPVWRLAIVSEGWAAGAALPTHAEVTFTDGETITMPANSYQRRGVYSDGSYLRADQLVDARITVSGGNFESFDVSTIDLAVPRCSGGTCVGLVVDEAGKYQLSVSEYGSDASKLADKIELTVTISDKTGAEVFKKTETIEFDDEIAAVFAGEVTFSEDPIGLDLSGKVSLLGKANRKAKQKTLGKGTFFGAFSRDGDGDLELAGADNAGTRKDGLASFKSSDSSEQAPPVVVYSKWQKKLGKFAKNVAQVGLGVAN